MVVVAQEHPPAGASRTPSPRGGSPVVAPHLFTYAFGRVRIGAAKFIQQQEVLGRGMFGNYVFQYRQLVPVGPAGPAPAPLRFGVHILRPLLEFCLPLC